MKNLTISVLAVVLGAAIVFGYVFYGKHRDMKDALEESNKQLLVLNEKVAQSNEERAGLYDKIQKNAQELERLENANLRISQIIEKLENAKRHISQLEDTIKIKDQALSRSDERIRQMEEEVKGEKKIQEAIRKEFSVRDDEVARLKEQLQEEESLGKAEIEELRSTYNSLISELKKQVKDREMTIREFEEMLTITFVDRVLFDFGKATVTSEGRSVLARVGEVLRDAPGMKIRVVGHTDNVPIRREYRYRFPSNWDLSSARAAAVVRYFQREGGLDAKCLEAVGRSFYEPVASNETEAGRAQNRRVEVVIAPMVGKQ
ncbi:MAG: OmpA family protein [Deltaproteobacteria bacterium]|nr:MAG: OmpA family protein [Deltaproteobacteria bacterium]